MPETEATLFAHLEVITSIPAFLQMSHSHFRLSSFLKVT